MYAGALAAHQEAGDLEYLAEDLETVAGFLPADRSILAAELIGAAEALGARHRLHMAPVLRSRWQATVDGLTRGLADDTFHAARRRGRDTALDDVVSSAVTCLREAADAGTERR